MRQITNGRWRSERGHVVRCGNDYFDCWVRLQILDEETPQVIVFITVCPLCIVDYNPSSRDFLERGKVTRRRTRSVRLELFWHYPLFGGQGRAQGQVLGLAGWRGKLLQDQEGSFFRWLVETTEQRVGSSRQ
jgi:hypothetical protein